MRTVTVEELEALLTVLQETETQLAAMFDMQVDYDTEMYLTCVYSGICPARINMQQAVESRRRSIASVRTDAEADKADAKRKDV